MSPSGTIHPKMHILNPDCVSCAFFSYVALKESSVEQEGSNIGYLFTSRTGKPQLSLDSYHVSRLYI